MNMEEKKQYVNNFKLGLEKWDKGYHILTVKDMATIKMGFAQYNHMLSDQNKILLGDMATDSTLNRHKGGYQAEFFRSRKDSESTRNQAKVIARFLESDNT